MLGGAIAARYASEHSHRLSRLVLVDTFGLRPFQPAPEFGLALANFLTQPTERTHTDLWHHCAFDLDALRQRMGERWEPFEAYNLDRARTPSVQAAVAALMEHFGAPAISPERPRAHRRSHHPDLGPPRPRDAACRSPRRPARASDGLLHVIENCNDDPPVEQPDALLRALRVALDGA